MGGCRARPRARHGPVRAGPSGPGGHVSHRPTMRTSTFSTTKRGRAWAATRPTSTAGTAGIAGAWTSVMRPQTRQMRCWWGVRLASNRPAPPVVLTRRSSPSWTSDSRTR